MRIYPSDMGEIIPKEFYDYIVQNGVIVTLL